MPKFKEPEIKRVVLPSLSSPGDEAYVMVRTFVQMKHVTDLQNEKPENAAIIGLSRLIVEWNMENEDGSPAEITPENVGKLPAIDIAEIQRHITVPTNLSEEKKS